MTFLQPFILWGLPLALLPLVIHLLNRMRYRTQRWAAMSFLFSANRSSTRYAKIRQFLILACRVLALAALVIAIARPLAGGWLGWALSPSPDVVLVLLDRSASMESRDASNSLSRREQALRAIAGAAAPFAERSRFVLIENGLRAPQEVAKMDFATLSNLALTHATDTAADIPAMLDAAGEWLAHNPAGLAEIWIASDLQRANWQPQSSRWAASVAKIAALHRTVRVRLLALTSPPAQNVSIFIADLNRHDHGGESQLDIALDIERTDSTQATLPLTMNLDDVRSHFDVATQSQGTRIHRSLPLDPLRKDGWGKIELPADGNPRDNAVYFVYGPRSPMHSAVVAKDGPAGLFLRYAAAPSGERCDVITGKTEGTDWLKYALVVWQAPLPAGKTAEQLRAFAQRGGVIIFYPPGASDSNSFAGAGWGNVETAGNDQPFHIVHWDQQEGPLAKTSEGLNLPLSALACQRRQDIVSGGESRAAFADSKPFLTERTAGSGRVFFCATSPDPEWSTLGDGRVLVPMLQRLLDLGGKRFSAASSFFAGDPTLAGNPGAWTSVVAPGKDVRFDAGIYRNGPHLISVNRPAEEDTLEVLEKNAARQLCGSLPVRLFEERGGGTKSLEGEIWRPLVIAMLLLLLAEGFLSLPMRSVHPAQKKTEPARAGGPLDASA